MSKEVIRGLSPIRLCACPQWMSLVIITTLIVDVDIVKVDLNASLAALLLLTVLFTLPKSLN
jgi:hypothetical protein